MQNQRSQLKHQDGVALLVAMVALLILTVFGMATMGELLVQSGTIRNEQFKQRVFYAAANELNANIKTVNQNPSIDDDPLIDTLLANKQGVNLYEVSSAPVVTQPTTVQMDNVVIRASRNDLLGCSGETIGRVKVLAGAMDVSAKLSDQKRNQGIRSNQRQRFVYCWP